jgi:hypothetical protein
VKWQKLYLHDFQAVNLKTGQQAFIFPHKQWKKYVTQELTSRIDTLQEASFSDYDKSFDYVYLKCELTLYKMEYILTSLRQEVRS